MSGSCVVIVKFILILCLYVNISQQRYAKEVKLSPFELDDFLNKTFTPKSWNGTWISDSAVIYLNQNGGLMKFDFDTKQSEVFLGSDILKKYSISSIKVSPDLSYVLIAHNESAVFRHSTTALFTIYDIKDKKYYEIADSLPLQLVTFAPKGHGLIYVKENNIYYLENFVEDVKNPKSVTTIGIVGSVYCGTPDWVYEEEVLASGSALWFSPDANYLAYAVFHDENVHNLSYTLYGTPGNFKDQYPHEAVIRYPKVGSPNPVVSVYVYDIQTSTTIEYQLPSVINNKDPNDYILYGLTWISSTEVAMISTNRVQNESTVIRCINNGQCNVESSYKETKGWIEPKIPTYNKNGTKKIEILPQKEGDDEYDHLVLTNIETNTISRLTYGKRTVILINGWDEKNGLIYFTASVINEPYQQHVYVVDENGNCDCLTCEIIVDGKPCTYGAATFSPNFSYQVKACQGPNPYLIQVYNAKNASDIFVWQDNSDIKQKLSTKALPVVKNLVVPINNQFSARVRMLLPPNLDESSSKKYPAVVYTYGGPNFNQISDAFTNDFSKYIVTNREYIWILIDGRGSGKDGHNKLFQMYRNFATVEIEDQIQVTKYLQENVPYIDSKRTGIWGWSYGGFCSSWALAKDVNHVFLFALSVAPVTNFLYYDTIYTERYMSLPTADDNEAGYNATDLTRVAEAFRGRNYFIIHGNADDNVHYQNSMCLVRALELADIDFRQQSYPDENHSLGGVSRHLYHTIDKYWAEQFNITSWNLKHNRK